MTALYSEDAIWHAPNEPAKKGNKEVAKAYRQIFAVASTRLRHQRGSTTVSRSGDMAFHVGTYAFSVETPKGPFSDEGKYLFVLTRGRTGEWRIAADSFSSNLASSAGQEGGVE